jgi:fatty-acyl-CoA synthase
VLSANRPEVLAVTAACLLGEYVVVPMHPLGSLEDHVHAVNDSKMEALIFDPANYMDRGTALAGRIEGLLALSLGPATIGTDLCQLVRGIRPVPMIFIALRIPVAPPANRRRLLAPIESASQC